MPFFPKSKKTEHLIPENEKMGIKCSVFWYFDTWRMVFCKLPDKVIAPEVLLS